MPQPIAMKKPAMPQLVNTRNAAEILGRSAATLKRWRAEGVGPNWIELQGRVSYDVNVHRCFCNVLSLLLRFGSGLAGILAAVVLIERVPDP
jgi:hypothetical protein